MLCAAARPHILTAAETVRDRTTLIAAALVLLAVGLLAARHGPALADEYVYLSGARHFARTGTLDARFYDARGILERGWPHQDVHSPGYTIVLGGVMALVRGGYWTAVAVNAVAYVAIPLLVHALALGLGASRRAGWAAGLSSLLLPALLPYVFWVMPEVLLAAVFLGALALARWREDGFATAVGAGLLLGAGVLLRETSIFGLPVLLAVQRRLSRAVVLGAALALFVGAAYVPLSRHRAPGGVNTWQAPLARPAQRFGFEMAVRSRAGNAWRGVVQSLRRARWNVGYVAKMGGVERGILGLFAGLFLVALVPRRTNDPAALRYGLALLGSTGLLLAALLGAFVIGYWSGFRYLMFLAPAFVPWIVLPTARPAWERAGRFAPAGIAVAGASLIVATFALLNDYKASRQARQEAIAAEAERYVTHRVARVALPNGWLFGLRRYPVEVISSLPADGGTLRALERAVWFDYLFLPSESPLVEEWNTRPRYRRVDDDGADGAFTVYRRLR